MATTEELRAELKTQLTQAEQRGVAYVDINSGQLHRIVGGFPGRNHSMPTCCNVMNEERRSSDTTLHSPVKGHGATLTIRYKLPR